MTIPADFPWRAGMLLPSGARVEVVEDDDESNIYINGERHLRSYIEPDPTDGPTLGALLAAVREAWKDPGIHAEPVNVGPPLWWHVYSGDSERRIGEGATEFAALLAAWNVRPK